MHVLLHVHVHVLYVYICTLCSIFICTLYSTSQHAMYQVNMTSGYIIFSTCTYTCTLDACTCMAWWLLVFHSSLRISPSLSSCLHLPMNNFLPSSLAPALCPPSPSSLPPSLSTFPQAGELWDTYREFEVAILSPIQVSMYMSITLFIRGETPFALYKL